MRDLDLTERVALVTGAERGLRRGMAEALADANASARTVEQLEELTTAVGERGGDTRAVPWNVGDAERAGEQVEHVLAEAGRVDVLLHVAGFPVRAPAHELGLGPLHREIHAATVVPR